MGNNKTVVTAVAVVLGAALLGVYYLSAIFLPVFIALVLAYLLEPLILPLTRRGINRTVAISLVFTAFTMFLVVAADLFVTALRDEFSNVQINLPAYASRLYEIIPLKVKHYLHIETPEKAYQQLNSLLETLRGVSYDVSREAFSFVKRAFASTLSFLLALLGYLITPLYLFYFLKDLPQLRTSLLELAPERFHDGIRTRMAEIDELLSAFIRGQLSVCAILAVLYSIGLYFIGIDLALVIGTLAGAAFIIPYFGTLLGIVLSVIMALLKFHDLLHPLLCVGWFALVQALEGGIITPKIVGDKVGLHPVITILALLVGGQLFGIIGMIIAVPVAAIIKVTLRSFLDYYRGTAFFTGLRP
jgi:predicted PurR-regulated permease PerM